MSLRGKRIMLAAAAIAVLTVLGILWRFTPLAELFDRERIAAWAHVVRQTPWAPVALILAYTPAAFLLFPRPVITLLAVVAFGRWLGFVYAMSGILLSALVAYFAGRLLPVATVKRYAGRHLEAAQKALMRHGVLAVFLIRVVPTAPHPVASALAGALRIPVWQFTLGTFLGMLPGALAATAFGGELLAALDSPQDVSYVFAAGVLLLVAVSIWAVRRWVKR